MEGLAQLGQGAGHVLAVEVGVDDGGNRVKGEEDGVAEGGRKGRWSGGLRCRVGQVAATTRRGRCGHRGAWGADACVRVVGVVCA